MVFSSSVFLFAFMPLSLAVYFLLPWRSLRNVWLLLASLVFYAWGEPVYVALMVFSIIANWGFALGIDRCGQEARSAGKLLLVCAVAVNLLLIAFFKYEAFLAENVNACIGAAAVPNLELPLPIGISFYTLQALSYVIDVYRGEVHPQRNVLYLGMYVACFPQLIAGPIVRYQTIEDQVLNRRETLDGFACGLRLFIVGLSKKVLLANVVAVLATDMLARGGSDIGAIGAWAGLVAFSFQILFDFSGYSDMAIGLGKMFGFSYLRNFNYPYLSKSGTEFWRRWHMSLGSFFRDYVYIPLGGNRCSVPRWVFNIFVVWFLTGLWHGAAWHFVIWGLFYGVLLVAEKLFLLKAVRKLPAIAQHLYGIVVFLFGWLLFWAEDMGQFTGLLWALVGGYGVSGASTAWELFAWTYVPVFLVCAVASTPVVPYVRSRLLQWGTGEGPSGPFMKVDLPAEKRFGTNGLCSFDLSGVGDPAKRRALECVAFGVDLALLALLILSVASVASGSFNPFIYFRF